MPAPKLKLVERGGGSIVIAEEIGNDRNLDYDRREIKYTLRFFPDTNEVALIKGDEILYSEEVS